MQMANRHVKRCSKSLISGKCKSKPQWNITSCLSKWLKSRRQDGKCRWICGAKGTLIHCCGEDKLVQTLWKTVWRFLNKLKIKMPNDPKIWLVSIYPGKMKILIWKDICTPVFTAALFAIAQTWKQPKCSSIDEGIKCSSIDEWIKESHIYIMGYYTAIKKDEILSFRTTWMDRKSIMLNEISQTRKHKYHMIHSWVKKKKKKMNKQKPESEL